MVVVEETSGAATTALRGQLASMETAVSDVHVAADREEHSQGLGMLHSAKRVVSSMVGRVAGRQHPQLTPGEAGAEGGGWSQLGRVLVQLVFAFIYYAMVVSKYPSLELDSQDPPKEARDMQALDAVSACCHPNMSFPNAVLSYACSAPRAAHTFHSTGTVPNYWIGCLLMTCFPCCTLWYVNAFTTMNEKLGGEKENCCISCLCSMFCGCCMIAQDAQTLDMVTGVRTGFCAIE